MHAIPEEISPPEGHLTEGLIENSKRSHTIVNIKLFQNVYMINTLVKLQHDSHFLVKNHFYNVLPSATIWRTSV